MTNRYGYRGDEEGKTLTAHLHYRDGTTVPLSIPAPRPDGILFEGFVSRGADEQGAEGQSDTRPIAVLFRRDTHKDKRDVDVQSAYPVGETAMLSPEAHYEQDSRWPTRGYARSRRRCSVCRQDKQWYFLGSLWATEQPSDTTTAQCESCYRKLNGT